MLSTENQESDSEASNEEDGVKFITIDDKGDI